jgi:hypothetical protein
VPTGDSADALAALPADATPLGSLNLGSDRLAASDLAALAAAQSPSPLASSLVHAGFDAVRRSAESSAPAVVGAAAPVPIGRHVSLLGDVPLAVLADAGPYVADRLGTLGHVEPTYGRDGPVTGHLRRDGVLPFRL